MLLVFGHQSFGHWATSPANQGRNCLALKNLKNCLASTNSKSPTLNNCFSLCKIVRFFSHPLTFAPWFLASPSHWPYLAIFCHIFPLLIIAGTSGTASPLCHHSHQGTQRTHQPVLVVAESASPPRSCAEHPTENINGYQWIIEEIMLKDVERCWKNLCREWSEMFWICSEYVRSMLISFENYLNPM